MLMPRRTKYRKQFRANNRGVASRGENVVFGEWGLQAQTHGWIDSRQIESARRAITGSLRRGGKVWIRIYPDKPVSKKPVEVRMGGGKGATDRWVAVVKPGSILFEVSGVPEDRVREAFRKAHHKLPLDTKVIAREEVYQ